MRLFFYFFIFITTFSCQNDSELVKQPKYLIPKEDFITILEELMMIEHQSQVDYPNFNDLYLVLDTSSILLFKKHNTNLKDFENSYNYYASNIDEMKVIYSKILDNMTKKLNDINVKSIDTIKIKN